LFERILARLRDKIRSRQYVMTLHAAEEMEDDGFSVFDVESCILTGQILERQRDSQTSEWKYIVRGQSLLGDNLCIVGKIGPTSKLVIITVYRQM
jgi:hypothetical protein